MEPKATGLALTLILLFPLMAIVIFGLSWRYTNLNNTALSWVLPGICIAVGLFLLIFFFSKEDRRPLVFFITYAGLIVLPSLLGNVADQLGWININDLDKKYGFVSALPILAPYILLLVVIFFRMSAWAGTFAPQPGAHAVTMTELRQQVLNLAQADYPFQITEGKRPDELIVDWKYADAAWLDQMRAHKVTQLTRYILRFYEDDHTVRVREYTAAFSSSAGPWQIAAAFKVSWGITFYEFQRTSVYDLQIENGKLVQKLSYSYSFDIEEIRAPLRAIINQNGWSWKQVFVYIRWFNG